MTLYNPVFPAALPSQVWINPERRSSSVPSVDRPYLDAVKAVVVRIGATQSGGVVLRALKRSATVITPMENYEKDNGVAHPKAPASTVPADNRASTAAGEPQRRSDGEPVTTLPLGSGLGCLSFIYFDLQRCRKHAVLEDGVLIHELAHAIRNAWGANRAHPRLRLPLSRSYAYPNSEEFFAQMILNMYLVERGRAPIVGYREWAYGYLRGARGRASGPSSAAQRRVAIEDKVRLEEQRYLRKLIALSTGMRGVITDLASVRVPHNPFRDVDRPDAPTYLPTRF